MGPVVPIELLGKGELAEVVEVHGDARLAARLAENGLRAGARLEALAPGDPLLVRIEETRLTFRTDGKVQVLVRILPPEESSVPSIGRSRAGS